MGDQLYESKVLPFGWNQSPFFFVRLLNIFLDWLKNPATGANHPLAARLASFDYALVTYLDDILIASYESRPRTQQLFDLFQTLFAEFGIQINREKSVLVPS